MSSVEFMAKQFSVITWNARNGIPQIDQNKLHKIFHLRSHSERSCPENYCKHLMQSESVATPWGRWAKTMPLICFPTGRRFCFELCPEFVISYPDYGLKIPRRLSFLFRNLPGVSAGGECKEIILALGRIPLFKLLK